MNAWLQSILGPVEHRPSPRAEDHRATLQFVAEFLGRGVPSDTSDFSSDIASNNSAPMPVSPTSETSGFVGPNETLIALEVSVGTDDPSVLEGISLTFQGMPEGARLTHGNIVEANLWQVSALDLKTLGVIVPSSCPSFDLQVVMRTANAAPQSATIHVSLSDAQQPEYDTSSETIETVEGAAPPTTPTNEDLSDIVAQPQPGEVLIVRMAPPLDATPQTLGVFADGRQLLQYRLTWPNGADIPEDIEVVVPNIPALPFEVVLRLIDAPQDTASRPALLGCEFANTWITPDSPVISAKGTSRGAGVIWTGDAILDLRQIERDKREVQTETEIDETQPAVEKTPAESINPGPAEENEPKANLLCIPVAPEDLSSEHFIEELQRLRDFIETSGADGNEAIYDRLGIDVSKWGGLRAIAPNGADIELEPYLVGLSTHGGRDGGRRLNALVIRGKITNAATHLRILGVPPGTLLSTGCNLGDGEWRVDVADLSRLYAMEAISLHTTQSHLWQLCDAREIVLTCGTFLTGDGAQRVATGTDDKEGIEVELTPSELDPEGHGSLTLTIGDVPPGVLLSHGCNHGEGVWTFEPDDQKSVFLDTGATQSSFALTLTCIAMNEATGESTVITKRVSVNPTTGIARLQSGNS